MPSSLFQNQMQVSIEGLIGVGKTTVLQELVKRRYSVAFENVDEWSLLPKMYSTRDPKISALFEIQILCSLAAREPVDFTERSISSALGVFMPQLIHDQDHVALIRQVVALASNEQPDVFVYLEADPQLCLRRIGNRQRKGEEGISLQYLRDLHAAHLQWLQTIPHIRILVQEDDSPAQIASKIEAGLKQWKEEQVKGYGYFS